MMERRFVREMVEGDRVRATFALRSKEMRSTRAGEAYLALELGDRTGSIGAVLFRPSETASAIPAGGVVCAEGRVTTFRGAKRISLDSLRPSERWDVAELVESASRPTSELVDELRTLVSSVSRRPLRRLLNRVFGDGEFFERFVTCPGSRIGHHSYRGGLLEHTVAVATLCRQAAQSHTGLDADLLVCAALLHDVGKVDEIESGVTIRYTDEGRLLGHVVLGLRRVHDATAKTGVSPDELLRLEHALLAHHGELEWGSPKQPSTLEALVLHQVDSLDAKAAGFSAALSGALLAEERWTDSENVFRRPLLAPHVLEDQPASGLELVKSA
jgi:3'-5' exoribonuclease